MKGFDTKFDTDLTLFIPLLTVACGCQTVGPFTCYLKLRYLSCNESTSQSLLLHRYLDQCEREHNQYFLVPLALQEEADQSIDFALSDTVRFLLKFCLAFLLD